MISKRSAFRGCLLGLAIGDAMGYPADTKTYPQLLEDYGPYGLQGFDEVNGYADVSSHTQLAAFTANGLLLGQTRIQVRDINPPPPLAKYVGLAQKEWATGQRRYDQPTRTHCWIFKNQDMRLRRCTDTRMVETLTRNNLEDLGTPKIYINSYDNPASIATAVAVSLFADPGKIPQEQIDRLGAECVALTYGNPLAFLPGAVVAHLISRCLRDHKTPLAELIEDAVLALERQFSREYRQVKDITKAVRKAIALAESRSMDPVKAMEKLKCDSGAEVLAGAVYAALLCEDDFDRAMVVAVNHSGHSAAVGSLVGAILGARNGVEELPDFYLESLVITPILKELADDLLQGCPMTKESKLFDADWDQKYLHGGY